MKMYEKSVQFYDSLYHFKNYEAASQDLQAIVHEFNAQAETLLDLACGTGKHLEYLKKLYFVEGIDINPDMIRIAKQKCPEILFHQADMADFSIERKFDVITCLFSSIAYVKTIDKMEQTLTRIEHHLNPGGIVIIEPFFGPENFWTGNVTANFVDETDLKIAWMYITEARDRIGSWNIHYLVGSSEGIQYFTELHEVGLFTGEEYIAAFQKVGLNVQYRSEGLFGRGVYIGKKPDNNE